MRSQHGHLLVVAGLVYCSTVIYSLGQDKSDGISLDIKVRAEGQQLPRIVRVTEIAPRGIGQRMGLVVNDVIVAVNGKKVDSVEKLSRLLKDESATVIWKGATFYYQASVQREFRTQPGPAPLGISSLMKSASPPQTVDESLIFVETDEAGLRPTR